jgi:hypothetical protein
MTTLNKTRFELGFLKLNWEKYGDLYFPGFKADYVSDHYMEFFRKHSGYPALKLQPNKGFFVMGPKGLGKTLNFHAYRKLQTKFAQQQMVILNVVQMEKEFKRRAELKTSGEYMDELIKIKELVIDDLGVEKGVLNDFGTKTNLISELLHQRYIYFQRGENITHLTTNLNLPLLKEFYEGRLIDRMREMTILKIIEGTNKRIEPIMELRPPEPEPEKLSESDKRRIYLQAFVDMINEQGTPFFDKNNVMWRFLVNNGLMDAANAERMDLKSQAEKESQLGKTVYEIASQGPVKVNYVKHLAMKEYFSKNTIDLSKYTNEQIML